VSSRVVNKEEGSEQINKKERASWWKVFGSSMLYSKYLDKPPISTVSLWT
jgi:hypothetical protein